MTRALALTHSISLQPLTRILLLIPGAYFVMAYSYLAWWHNQTLLWNTTIHENGRLTLAGSLLYFDHFLGSVPMILVFALCAVGGIALTGGIPTHSNPARAAQAAKILLGSAMLLVLLAFAASVLTVGWDLTLNYALQRVERDGIMSTGGNWNQFQLSNIPIALGTISLSSSLVIVTAGTKGKYNSSFSKPGKVCIWIAVILAMSISIITFPGWQAFLNSRWMAHSIREIATHPLTSIPLALVSILYVERFISGLDVWLIKPRRMSIILLGLGLLILLGELIYLSRVDVMAMAQKPSFAADGLSVPYLLSSHLFEHFLDFILIIPLTGGIYALTRWKAQNYQQ